MPWTDPTQAQLDQATNHGIEYALAEIHAGNAGPQESPLSGEWADAIVPRDVAYNVGYMEDLSAHGAAYAEGETALADAWEQGYDDTWMVYLDNIQHPGRQ